jgi:phage tail-like protein
MPADPIVYPFVGFNFEIQVDGGVSVGGFSEVSGLGAEIEIEEYSEGGLNTFVHRLAKKTKYNNLVAKRGMTSSNVLYSWYKDIVAGKIQRRKITVTLLDRQRSPLKNWTFNNAFPVKWSGSDLKSDSSAIAIESVEFVHQGLIWM